jgi:hypothetical protein
MRPTTRVQGWMRQEALWVIVLAAIASNISILMQIADLASVIPD